MFARLLLAGTIAMGSVVGGLAVASAQYPPPVGNCVVVASATVSDQGGTVKLTITVRDLDGNVVAGEPVPLSVTKQPGSNASVQADAVATDANGVITATLNVGSAPGVVEVTAATAEVSCRASVTVQRGDVQGAVELPETGSGSSGFSGLQGLATLALSAGALLVGVGIRRRAN